MPHEYVFADEADLASKLAELLERDPEDLEKSAAYARRAIAADPKLGDPHVWLGYALWRQWKVEEGFSEELRAGFRSLR